MHRGGNRDGGRFVKRPYKGTGASDPPSVAARQLPRRGRQEKKERKRENRNGKTEDLPEVRALEAQLQRRKYGPLRVHGGHRAEPDRPDDGGAAEEQGVPLL